MAKNNKAAAQRALDAIPVFYRATMEGPTFTFEAFGRTEMEASSLLLQAMHKHGKEYDLRAGWFNDMDTSCVPVQIGSAYRDGEKL